MTPSTEPVISVLTPTRNRPDGVTRLVKTARETAADPGSVEFVFYVDDDAPGSVPGDLGVTVVTGERIVLSDMWNKCAEAARGEILMQCGDDIAFRTPGWDRMVTGAFSQYEDRIVFVYGRDGTGIHGEDFGTHGFAHRRWTEAVGYLTPPWFSSDYGDTWLNDLAARIGRKHFLPDLLTEHLHPAVRKGDWDQNHRDRLERAQRDNVAALWESLEPQRAADAAKLRKAMTSD